MNLYNMTQELLDQLAAPGIDTDTGEIDWDAYKANLDRLRGDWNDKACNLAMYIKTLEAESDAIVVAANAMQERAKAIDAQKKRLSEYLLDMIKLADKMPSNAYVKVGTRKSKSVHIVDSNLIPAEYMVQKPAPLPEPDKMKIKDAINAGITIDGAFIEEKINLSIK